MIVGIQDLVAYLRVFHRSWSEEPCLDPALIPDDLPDGLALICRALGSLVELEPTPGSTARRSRRRTR